MRFILFALVVFSAFSCGSTKKPTETRNTSVENPTLTGNDGIITTSQQSGEREEMKKITGMVQIYGNEPRTFVGIVDEKGTEYAVYPRTVENELRELQGHLIEFTVIMLDEPKGEGGMYLKGGTVTPVSWVVIQ